jgi:pyruvate formate-lyase 1-activating enzyme
MVHSWELVTAVDGPGTRLTVFLTGCPLRCRYCHNPDTMEVRNGTPESVDDVIARVLRYRSIFRATGGGLTLSGGEPLFQIDFTRRVLRVAHEAGIHTAVDTSGFLGARLTDDDLDTVDLVLLDVKSGIAETYRTVTTRELNPTVEFGNRLHRLNKRMWLRFVLVPGLTDAPANVHAVADIAARWADSIDRVEVLPFHNMGADKWNALGMDYQLADVTPPDESATETVREVFRSRGLTTY